MSREWIDYDGGEALDEHRNARQIRVAPDVAVIPGGAFEGCAKLKAVDLSSVTTISVDAFNRCINLERVIWPTASAVEIGVGAFAWCRRLSEIVLSNVVEIGMGAFDRCTSLKRVNIPSSVAAIEASTFHRCDRLVKVELGEGIRRIGMRTFLECSKLAEVELNEGLQTIGYRSFSGCSSLKRVTIPSSVTLIEGHAFLRCAYLAEVTLREGMQMIKPGAFDGCAALERINIPPMAFVVTFVASERGHFRAGGNCQLMRSTTMPVPAPGDHTLVVSKWLQYWSPEQLEQADAKVCEIVEDYFEVGEKIQCVSKWFAYYELVDVSTMLELAIWKINMNGNEQDAEARQASRRQCGSDMNVIIPAVVPFLDAAEIACKNT